jgi:uncharacterized protein GlcG (DUF336 family)
MHLTPIMPMVLAGLVVGAQLASAEVLNTHRIPALLALEAASESVGVCAKQGYLETAVVVDADGATIVALRGDGAGIHTLDSAHDKAYTSVSFKNDTIALEERGRVEIAPLSKLPHVMFFGGGVVIKLGDETIGAIGASGDSDGKMTRLDPKLNSEKALRMSRVDTGMATVHHSTEIDVVFGP